MYVVYVDLGMKKQLFAFMALTDWFILCRCNVLLGRTAESLIIQVRVHL
jgi:hypothetical protein